MPKTVILGGARTPIGKLGGGLASLDAPTLGGCRDGGRARARGRRTGAGRARRDGHRAPGRAGPDPVAPGADQGRDPGGCQLRDDQQGLRVRHAGRRAARHGDPRRRARRRCRRRHGVDVDARRTCSTARASAAHGRRAGGRRDARATGSTSPWSGKHMARGGDRGRRRARDHARRHGPLGAALARAAAIAAIDDGRMAEEIVGGLRPHGQGEVVDRSGRGAATATRRSTRSPSCRRSSSRTARTPRAISRRQRRRRRDRRRERALGKANGKETARRRSSRPPRPPTISPTSRGRRRWPRSRRWRRPACSRPGRSVGDQRGVRVRRARFDQACSASTRTA